MAWDRTVLRRRSIGKIEHDLVHVAPPPTFRRIVALDDRVAGGMEMLGCVPVRRIVTATDVAARPAKAQMNPRRSQFQAFLASAIAGLHVADAFEMSARLPHDYPSHNCPADAGLRTIVQSLAPVSVFAPRQIRQANDSLASRLKTTPSRR